MKFITFLVKEPSSLLAELIRWTTLRHISNQRLLELIEVPGELSAMPEGTQDWVALYCYHLGISLDDELVELGDSDGELMSIERFVSELMRGPEFA